MLIEIKMIFEVTSKHFRETRSADRTLKSLINAKMVILSANMMFKCYMSSGSKKFSYWFSLFKFFNIVFKPHGLTLLCSYFVIFSNMILKWTGVNVKVTPFLIFTRNVLLEFLWTGYRTTHTWDKFVLYIRKNIVGVQRHPWHLLSSSFKKVDREQISLLEFMR